MAEVISNTKDESQKSWFKDKKYCLGKFVRGWMVGLSIPVGFANVDLFYEGQDDKDEIDYSKISKPSIQEGLDLIKLFCDQIKSELSNNLKLVVFVDDLDRCSSKKTLEILELIKILLDMDGIVYVVGLNIDTVNRSFEEEQKKVDADNYIQKII